MSDIVKLPAPTQATRVETGPVQFGEDWPGVFIRGDDAGWYAFTLKALLEDNPTLAQDHFGAAMVFGNLQQVLSTCVLGPASEMMKYDVDALKAEGRSAAEIELLQRLAEQTVACIQAGRRDYLRWSKAEARVKRLEGFLKALLKAHMPRALDDKHIDAYNAADDFLLRPATD